MFLKLERGLVTASEIFRSSKTDAVVYVFSHSTIGTGFLDETGIDNAVNGDVALGTCQTRNRTGQRQRQKVFFIITP